MVCSLITNASSNGISIIYIVYCHLENSPATFSLIILLFTPHMALFCIALIIFPLTYHYHSPHSLFQSPNKPLITRFKCLLAIPVVVSSQNSPHQTHLPNPINHTLLTLHMTPKMNKKTITKIQRFFCFFCFRFPLPSNQSPSIDPWYFFIR
jgi:hypothetical protein